MDVYILIGLNVKNQSMEQPEMGLHVSNNVLDGWHVISLVFN